MATSITSGSAEDAIRQLLQTSYDRSNSLFGKSDGLSPEALSAFRTEATSGIDSQYQSAAQALNSQLLRRGAVGQGALPSSGGDISRAYQPLYSAMEAAKTKSNRDTILTNETAKRESLYQNNQLAQNALSSAGGFANNLADIEPGSTKQLLLAALLSTALGKGSPLTSGTGTNDSGSHGIIGDLLTGGGTNDTGNFGIVGDLLGKIPGAGGGSALDAFTDQAGQAAAAAAPQMAADYGQIAKDLAGYAAPAAAASFIGPGVAAGIPGATTSILGPTGFAAPEIFGATAASASAPATGITGALGLGGGSGLFGLGAATIPVVGAAVVGITLLAKHFFGNGGDRMAANDLTGPGSVHDFFTQATAQADALPEGPEKVAAYDERDRQMEKALVQWSQRDKDHYYQAKNTLRHFAGFSSVRPLLG